MSDSVDRVFSHALSTVNKIRTGAEKPPAATRLKLYGLYKQAMEGDVEGILPRPSGSSDEAKRAREKYDAWSAQAGTSRTEAKRRYITTLIETMHKYAAPTPETRELVSELEFVWDQIKSNVSSSSSSSPLQTMSHTGIGLQDTPRYESLDDTGQLREGRPYSRKDDAPMRVLSPMSESQEEELDEDDDENAEFVDAPDSQFNGLSTSPVEPPSRSTRDKSKEELSRQKSAEKTSPTRRDPADQRWRKRVEGALIRLTAEVAALREQLESRKLFSRGRKHSFIAWISWILWSLIKYIGLNILVLCIVLVWMRRREDRRLELAVRVLLGDAVAEVRRVGAEGIKEFGKIQLPVRLPTRKAER